MPGLCGLEADAGHGWTPTSVCRWCKALYSFFISDSRSSNRQTGKHNCCLSTAQPNSHNSVLPWAYWAAGVGFQDQPMPGAGRCRLKLRSVSRRDSAGHGSAQILTRLGRVCIVCAVLCEAIQFCYRKIRGGNTHRACYYLSLNYIAASEGAGKPHRMCQV